MSIARSCKFTVNVGVRQNQLQRLYRERFPEGPHPTWQTILKVVKRLRETGCVTSRPGVRWARNVGRKVQPEYVLAYALAHLQSSTKMIRENCSHSKSRVWTILNESSAHLYRSTPVQAGIHLVLYAPDIHLVLYAPDIHLVLYAPDIHLVLYAPDIHLVLYAPDIHLMLYAPDIHLMLYAPDIHLIPT
ncbi:hypothetical protein AVEN_244741-1 [Araneus ventricosus]|uniref:DUF4817 domain-containing protein n=1 Tax=Araneus ventricosus TaxID=182803 RepID=A0A4Y2BTX7_ARAVE|nr:hypothetical protein AVEN_244741-1 [Araneus ventricosus]